MILLWLSVLCFLMAAINLGFFLAQGALLSLFAALFVLASGLYALSTWRELR